MNSGYFPVVVSPGVRPQTSDIQAPFYFGGSQVPNTIMTGGAIYNPTGDPVIAEKNRKIGEVMRGFRKGMPSKTHPGDMDFTTKKGDKVFHRDGHFVRMPFRPYKKLGAVMRK
jgi:hypothetical protein